MSITKDTIKETIKTIMAEEGDYKAFFKKALEKAGKSIPSMSDEEKKKFFNKIDAAWDGKGEKNEGNAFGAAVTKAKEKGEDEFEVDGKTYKVESVNESLEFLVNTYKDGKSYIGYYDSRNRFDKTKFIATPYGNTKDAIKVAKSLAKKNKGKYVDDFKINQNHPDNYAKTGSIKESVNEAKNDNLYVVIDFHEKGGGFVMTKPSSKKLADDSARSITKTRDITKREVLKVKDARKIRGLAGKEYLKEESVKESHSDCGCGCGGVTEGGCNTKSVNEAKSITLITYGGKKTKYNNSDINGFISNLNLSSEDLPGMIYKASMGKPSIIGTNAKSYNKKKEAILKLFQKIKSHNGNVVIDVDSKNPSYKHTIKFESSEYKVGDTINEARLGKVLLLKDVEKGKTSSVEGVKLSKDLAFEIRTFLERPMLSRSRTGIKLDNSKMGDVIPMLAKIGIHKRLSSTVKQEFADLLKKYK